MAHSAPDSRKTDRLEIRLGPAQRDLLDEAAVATAQSTSAFVLTHATAAAEGVLADRTRFTLPADRWDAFTGALEGEAEPRPGIVSLLASPSVLDE